MKLKQIRKNSTLKVDGKTLTFKDGTCEVKKITKDIQFFIDAGYIKIEESENGKSTNN